ncbi:MAG: SU10 major capsid protein [Phycisphaerae bacterium]
MAFTGKATYAAGSDLPEIAEDVADIVSIVSPYETPLLDRLGDPARAATSTFHEWLEDELLPNTDTIDDADWTDPAADATFGVANAARFRVGDQVRAAGSEELMMVTAVDTTGGTITVTRGYGGTTPEDLSDGLTLHILGNAALEGDDSPAARFTTRVRKGNWTQIFTAGIRISGSELAARKIAVADELDYQKQERLRELLRDLENTVVNGTAPASDPQGSAGTRRTMRGVLPSLSTNIFRPGEDGFPAEANLTEEQLNLALRAVWEQSASRIDTIVVNGHQKRRINGFITSVRAYGANDVAYRDLVSTYESDFGVCRVVLCRHMPADAVLLLDSSRVDVLPLAGRSFHYKPLASTGDYESGEVIGEYTVELRNENAHGVIRSLTAS